MTSTAIGTAKSTAWCDNLARVTADGHFVVAASMHDRGDVGRLVEEMLEHSSMAHSAVSAFERSQWVEAVLSSYLWLVLILKDSTSQSCGIAICEYIAYDVDANSRVLKCKQFYVKGCTGRSLFSPSKLLLDAMMEAARRSPQLRDVFIVSTGALDLDRLRRALQRYGFRRIGTQHVGLGKLVAAGPRNIKEVHSLQDLSRGEIAQLRSLARSFFAESARATLGAISLDLERLFASALGNKHASAVAYLAYMGEEIVGFIAGREGALPLSTNRYLQSTFFYVTPRFRATALALKLFDTFASKARVLGLDGAFLGTSSDISTDRVCRLLELRGYSYCGDVLAARVSRGSYA